MNAPQDPMTVMAAGMAQMRELFISMIEADFTETQACKILGAMMAAAAGGGTDEQ